MDGNEVFKRLLRRFTKKIIYLLNEGQACDPFYVRIVVPET